MHLCAHARVSERTEPSSGGIMGLHVFRLTAGAILLAAAGPASAAYVFNGTEVAIFNFTTGNNTGIQDGNARFYSATSPDFGTVHARVTGWSLDPQGTVRDSKLAV